MWIEYTVEASRWYMKLFLPGPEPFSAPVHQSMQGDIPLHLQAAYRVLHLPAEASLDDVHRQYRALAKCSHPDAGGNHADFLALQQAYERVTASLQAGGGDGDGKSR